MATEIERKYLPKDPHWRPQGTPDTLVQGYFWAGETAQAHIEQAAGSGIFSLILRIAGHAEPWRLALPEAEGRELLAATQGHEMGREWTLRVRRSSLTGGMFCIKGKAVGIARPEYEFPLPPSETEALLQLCQPAHIGKDRYKLPHAGYVFEVDVYHAPLPHEPAVVIEVELTNAADQPALPEWVGTEVTHDRSYANAHMARQRWLAATATERSHAV